LGRGSLTRGAELEAELDGLESGRRTNESLLELTGLVEEVFDGSRRGSRRLIDLRCWKLVQVASGELPEDGSGVRQGFKPQCEVQVLFGSLQHLQEPGKGARAGEDVPLLPAVEGGPVHA
jgi:hypothetical protein